MRGGRYGLVTTGDLLYDGGMYEATGIILAGGEATRLAGVDKARLVVGEGELIEGAVKLMRKYFAEVVIVRNGQRNYGFDRVKEVADEEEGCGPLMGLYCGLRTSGYDLNFVMGCDMPWVQGAMVQLLMDAAGDNDVVVPVVNGYLEPLLAVYHRRVAEVVKEYLDKKYRKLIIFYDDVKVKKITEEQLREVDPKLRSFLNINTPENLDAAKAANDELGNQNSESMTKPK
ncbi:MAG: molybdenum cofactor guanylyltransferase [Planctomycetes bacterium]|nr:molybdenum cofactor guanylyltransferase [Planctomycetota bacterium]